MTDLARAVVLAIDVVLLLMVVAAIVLLLPWLFGLSIVHFGVFLVVRRLLWRMC